MLWIITDGGAFYDKATAQEAIIESLLGMFKDIPRDELEKRTKKIFFDPSREVLHSITDQENIRESCIVSPKSPDVYDYKEMGFFTSIEIRDDNYPFTREQRSLKIPKDFIIQRRYGLVARLPTKTLDDLGGLLELKEDFKNMLILEKAKVRNMSAFFYFGTPGAGKSFTAECLAGSTNRILMELDLAYYMSLPSPTKALEDMFDFLLSQKKSRYLIFIDEIEKMFDFTGGNLVATQVLGKLLTRLNDIYSLKTNNILIFATANNITKIVKYNPEFLRRGRFNRLYFLNYPSRASAIHLFTLFKKINNKDLLNEMDKNYIEYTRESKTKSLSLLGNSKINEERVVVPGEENDERSKFFDTYFDAVAKGLCELKDVKDLFTFNYDNFACIRFADEKYKSIKKTTSDNFIYSPPEINAFVEEMQDRYILMLTDKNNCTIDYAKIRETVDGFRTSDDYFTFLSNESSFSNLIQAVASVIIPLQLSASEGVSSQIAQSKSFNSKDASLNQFMEIS